MKKILFLLTLMMGIGCTNLHALETEKLQSQNNLQVQQVQRIMEKQQDVKALKPNARSRRRAERAAKKELERKTAKHYKDIVDSKHYIIYCERMQPLRSLSRSIGREYTLEMKGDTVYSHLPYMGVAHNVSSNNRMNVLDFEEPYSNYEYKISKKKYINVSFDVRSDIDMLNFTLTIYPNGKADIYITSSNRDSISFSGNLESSKK